MKNESAITNMKDSPIPITNLTVAESQLIVDSIDSIIVDTIEISNINRIKKDNPTTNILLLHENKKAINALYIIIKQRFESKVENGTDYQKVIAKQVLDNFDTFLKYHGKQSNVLKTSKIVIQEFDKDDNLIDKTEGGDERNTKDSAYDKHSNSVSLEERGDPEVFALLAGLFYCNENSETEYNQLGEKKLADYKITKNRAIKILAGHTDENDMYRSLLRASEQYPEFTQLTEALGDPSDYQGNRLKHRLWMKVRQTFAMKRVPIYQTHFVYNEQGILSIRFLESNTDIQKVSQQFTRNFKSIISSPYVRVNGNGVNVLNVKQLLADFTDEYFNKKDRPFLVIKNGKRREFLNAIGFQFSDKPGIDAGIEAFKKMNLLAEKLRSLDDQNEVVTNPIRQMKADIKTNRGTIIKGESNNVKYLLTLEVQFSDVYSNYSAVNPNGDKVYELSEYNALTTTTNILNDAVKYPTYQDLIKHPFMSRFDITKNPLVNGLILYSLFDLSTGKRRYDNDDGTSSENRKHVTLNIVNLWGANIFTKDAVSDVGVGTSGLDMKGKQLFNMNATLATGIQATPQHESKSSYYGIKLSKVWSTEGSDFAFGYNYFPMISFITKGRLDSKITDYLKLGLIGELTRTGWLNEGLNADSTTPEGRALREKGGADIEGYNQRARSLTLFDRLLSESMKAKLLKLVEKNTPDNLADQVNELTAKLHEEFKRYFDALEVETWNQVKDNFIISNEIVNKLSRYIASIHGAKDVTTTLEKHRILNKSYAINSLVAKMESYKIFYGDPAFYNLEKKEANKRIAGFGSTKTTLSLTPGSIDYVNNFLGRKYAKSIGIAEKKFNGTFDSRIYQDVKVDSALMGTPENPGELRKHFTDYFTKRFEDKSPEDIKELVEQTLDPYTNMKEGDAQGYITLDAWRIAKVLQGQWNDELELLYYKEIDGQELTLEEFDKFFSVMKAQYTGPLQNSHLYVPGFHKYSLMPLLPCMMRSNSTLAAINRDMMEQGHDYMTFESGSKIATIGKPQPFYSDLATRSPNIPVLKPGESSPFVANTIDLHYFGEIRN